MLAGLVPDVSRSTIQRWIAEGRVAVDGEPCRSRDRVGAGAVIEVDPGPPPPSDAEPDPTVEFGILYEDDDVIVIDKPAGLVMHPGRGHPTGTLVNGLLARTGFVRPPSDPRDPEGRLRPGVVHRLDRDTSGVVVVAKTERARESLKDQLAARTVGRTYQAICQGVPVPGVIRTRYGRDPKSRLRFTSLVVDGREAATRVAVLEKLAGGRAALVECRLETGRTHQIRVHLLERSKTPIVGDPVYGRRSADPTISQVSDDLGRQALHAATLGFEALDGSRVEFSSPLPDDFCAALARLRAFGD